MKASLFGPTSAALIGIGLLTLADCGNAQDKGQDVFASGLRIGSSVRGEQVLQTDIFVGKALPWGWKLSPDWILDTMGEMALSWIHHDEGNGAEASVSTDLVLSSPVHKLVYTAGIGVGLLADSTIGELELGGPIFFLGHFGISLPLGQNFSLSARYSHQSNGHLYDENPSINLVQVGFGYYF